MKNTRGVRNGTPLMRESLCYTCEHAHVRRGFSESEEQVFCTFVYGESIRLVPFPVCDCSDYKVRGTLGLDLMTDIATVLEPPLVITSSRKAGFVKPPPKEENGASKNAVEEEE